MISRIRLLATLAATVAAAGAAAMPASARTAEGHLTGNLHVTFDDTSGACDENQYNDHWTGDATLDDTLKHNGDGTDSNPDSSVLNFSGSWAHCNPQGGDAGTGSGTITGWDLNTLTGTQVDWGYDVNNPGSLAMSLVFPFHATTSSNADGGCYASAFDDYFSFSLNFPMPTNGYGTTHVDKVLTYQGGDNGEAIYHDHWVGGTCPKPSIDNAVAHVTGDITVSPLSSSTNGGSNNGGSNNGATNAAGTASGGGSATASGNGTVTVGTTTCAGPGSCTDSTTVAGSSTGSSHKLLVAAGKKSKTITYGHSKKTIAAGKTATLKVRLSKKARALLKKHKKLKATATIVVSSAGAKTVTKHFKLTIKAPRHK